mmetsp:Transcript_18382/g.39797  ORF Transcript_18382/g.39797 Transcript_18382/m.39797 type:complete len:104 (+) Transcript_18382:74-385(+)
MLSHCLIYGFAMVIQGHTGTLMWAIFIYYRCEKTEYDRVVNFRQFNIKYNKEDYDFILSRSRRHMPISTAVGRRVQESSNCQHHQNVTYVDKEYRKCFEGQCN